MQQMDPGFLRGLEACLSHIVAGEPLPADQLIAQLAVESKEARIFAFIHFAEAYFKAGDVAKGEQYLDRAWRLTGPTPDLYPAYTQVLGVLGKVEASQEAHKRMGLAYAAQGATTQALECFDLWHYVYPRLRGEDHYKYDGDILAAVDRLAAPFKAPARTREPLAGRKPRIAHLVQGALEYNSVLMKIARLFAVHGDRGQMESAFFFLDSESALRASKQGGDHLDFFRAQGCGSVPAPEGADDAQRLVGVASAIREYAPDLLVCHAGLASFRTYFVLSQAPAERLLGIISGPPPQFAPPQLDWGICWTKHNLMEVPVDCTHVPLETELPDMSGVVPLTNAEMGIPEGATLIVAGGRSIKFSDPRFWSRVKEVLARHPEAWLTCIGPTAEDLGALLEGLPPRVRFVAWTDQYLRILARADLVLDTFPNGGAVIIMDAMALGKPIVTVENDYTKPYDQIDWMPAHEYMYPGCELVLPRGDAARYLEVVDRLIRDVDYRKEMGDRMAREVRVRRGHPERMVKHCEEVFRKVLGVSTAPAPAPAPTRGAAPVPGKPTFTVMVPTYNQAQYLPECLDSLLAQTRGDWEAVVVNDGSTDGTREVLEAYAARDPRIRAIHQANGGVGAALNEALRQAHGAWICWLSSDDLFEPHALEVFGQAMASAPDVRYFHSDFREKVHETGQLRLGPPARVHSLPAKPHQTVAFLQGNMIHGISVCIRKDLFGEVGFFKPELKYAQDMDMWLRMSAKAELRYLDVRTCITRVHAGQGTLGFPEAGALDSARACLDFLNANPFEALFPHVDLATGDGITLAIQAALGAALNLNACMYAGVGPTPALLDRMAEWLQARCPAAYRDSIVAGLQGLEAQMGEAPAPLREAVGAMARRTPVRYETRDALALMRSQWRQAQAAGDGRSAALLARYLEKVAGISLGEEGPFVSEAFLLRPDFQSDLWAEQLLAYFEAFRPGEPVALLLQLDPAAGGPGEGEVGAAVVEMARQLGLEAFPDVVLVPSPHQLLEHLRPYVHIHRLPLGEAGTDSDLRRRFAARLKAQV